VPAKDHYHDTVRRALIKDGWVIIQEQVYLSHNNHHKWVDLCARHESVETPILVEIKGFEGTSSRLDALTMAALGQSAVFTAMLKYLNLTEQLVLAVPKAVYDGIFQAPAAQRALQDLGIRLFVFDPIAEEVVLWAR